MRILETHSLAIAAMAVLCAALALSPLPDLPKVLVALALVFWLPGAALMASIFPDDAPSAGRRCLAVVLSMACAVLVGILLNVAGTLTPAGWALALAAVSILAALPGAWRSGLRARTLRPVPRPRRLRLRTADVVLFMLAAALSLSAYHHARIGAFAHNEYRYTEFWLTPTPTSATTAMLGIRNAEREPVSYEIEVLDDEKSSSRWQPLSLEPGSIWTAPLALKRGPRPRRVEARLFRDGDRGTIYRRVWLEVPAGAAAAAGRTEGSKR